MGLLSRSFAIRFLDPTLGLLEAGAQGSLSQSLFIPLIAPCKLYFSNRRLISIFSKLFRFC